MFELCLQCPQDRVEALSDALEALAAQSVSVEDADALTDAENALFGEPGMPAPQMGWRHSRVTALFSTQDAAHSAARLLHVAELLEGCSAPGITAVADQDWVRLTQAQFAPVAITPAFWIVPSWHAGLAEQGILRIGQRIGVLHADALGRQRFQRIRQRLHPVLRALQTQLEHLALVLTKPLFQVMDVRPAAAE